MAYARRCCYNGDFVAGKLDGLGSCDYVEGRLVAMVVWGVSRVRVEGIALLPGHADQTQARGNVDALGAWPIPALLIKMSRPPNLSDISLVAASMEALFVTLSVMAVRAVLLDASS